MSRSALSLSHRAVSGALGHPSICVRTALNAEGINVTSQRYYSLALYKRLKQKSTWVSKNDPNIGRDADFYLPDRERLGTNYDLNSTLHKYKVVPSQDAYRNLHLRGLVMLANGTTDKTKALHVPVDSDDFTIYFGDKVPAFLAGAKPKVLPIDQYKQIVKEIKDHLSDTPSILVHDGALGSHAGTEVRARIITDDAAAALYVHHVVPRVSIKDAKDFKHDITVYITPNFKPANLASVGITSDKYVIVDVARGIAIIGGALSTSAIRAGLVAVAQPKFFVDHSGIPLDASIVGVKGAEKPVLVLGELPQSKDSGLEIHGSHNATWTPNGLVRFFDGATYTVEKGQAVQTSRGDLVEDLKGGSSRVTTRQPPTANIHGHPSAIIILANDSTNVLPTISKVSSDYVAQFLLAGFSGKSFKPLYATSVTADPHGVAATLGSLVKQHNVEVFVINVSAKDKPLTSAQISSLVKSVATGGAKDASVLSNVFSKLSPLTSIKGSDIPLDPTKRGWDNNSLKAEASKFEKSVSEYLSTTFPPPPPPESAAPQQPAQQPAQQK